MKQIPDPETPASAFRVDEANKRVIPAQGIAPVVAKSLRRAGGQAALPPRRPRPGLDHRADDGTGRRPRRVIKHGLAMGADEGVLVDDPALHEVFDVRHRDCPGRRHSQDRRLRRDPHGPSGRRLGLGRHRPGAGRDAGRGRGRSPSPSPLPTASSPSKRVLADGFETIQIRHRRSSPSRTSWATPRYSCGRS
ncbi:MAG: hypothetical protein U0531_03340 [Dehalococcoidia bacterium]